MFQLISTKVHDLWTFLKLITGVGLMGAIAGIVRYIFGKITIDFRGNSDESYFHTPDIVPNLDIYPMLQGRFSYTKFRLKLQISPSYKIQIHGVEMYAFHKDLVPEWPILRAVGLPIVFDDIHMHTEISKFAYGNSRPTSEEVGFATKYRKMLSSVDNATILDNGNGDFSAETISSEEVRDIVIARIGEFPITINESRKIYKAEYCDALLIIRINAVDVAFLCSLPKNRNDENRPRLFALKTFRGADTSAMLVWASKHRPKLDYTGGRTVAKLRLKLRR